MTDVLCNKLGQTLAEPATLKQGVMVLNKKDSD